MAKIHPKASRFSSSSSSSYMTSRRETFTIWMKSLVLHSNGFTVFDSNGEIVYRIDNYDSKCCDDVYLMDLKGKVLFTILKKKLSLFGCWEGYRGNSSKEKKEKPGFQVKKVCKILKGGTRCEVTVGCDTDQPSCYRVQKYVGRSACKIVDEAGVVVAEVRASLVCCFKVKQKQSSEGVRFGNDVITLVVEPNLDHSLIMGIIVVYSLINHQM